MEVQKRIELLREVARRRLETEIKARRLPANMTIDADPLPAAKGNEIGGRLRAQLVLPKKLTKPVFVMNWDQSTLLKARPSSLVDGFFGLLLQHLL